VKSFNSLIISIGIYVSAEKFHETYEIYLFIFWQIMDFFVVVLEAY